MARGWLEGVIQPVILSVQARAVGRHQQGAVVGLRQTGQRLSSILVPPVMGAIADRFGAGHSFLIYAALMLPLCGLLALVIRRLHQSGRRDKLFGGSAMQRKLVPHHLAVQPVVRLARDEVQRELGRGHTAEPFAGLDGSAVTLRLGREIARPNRAQFPRPAALPAPGSTGA